jgi:hypothetical protein
MSCSLKLHCGAGQVSVTISAGIVFFSPSHWPVVGKRYHAFVFQATKPFELCAVILAYRQDPTAEERQRLATEFDNLFTPNTGYEELDQCIAKTKAKKESLLLVLNYPELP